mmetsp:Transcript_23025/g.64696  ORF Transcript_23025/g.64696 Transcript_23025/m.64696 type:complete len:205 (+) Transcript_23025:162-776(+)
MVAVVTQNSAFQHHGSPDDNHANKGHYRQGGNKVVYNEAVQGGPRQWMPRPSRPIPRGAPFGPSGQHLLCCGLGLLLLARLLHDPEQVGKLRYGLLEGAFVVFLGERLGMPPPLRASLQVDVPIPIGTRVLLLHRGGLPRDADERMREGQDSCGQGGEASAEEIDHFLQVLHLILHDLLVRASLGGVLLQRLDEHRDELRIGHG